MFYYICYILPNGERCVDTIPYEMIKGFNRGLYTVTQEYFWVVNLIDNTRRIYPGNACIYSDKDFE